MGWLCRAGHYALGWAPRCPFAVVMCVDDSELYRQVEEQEGTCFLSLERPAGLGFTSSADRQRGYQRALAAAGIGVEDGLIRLGPHDAAVAAEHAAQLLKSPDPRSAIFAASDTQAIGVLSRRTGSARRYPASCRSSASTTSSPRPSSASARCASRWPAPGPTGRGGCARCCAASGSGRYGRNRRSS